MLKKNAFAALAVAATASILLMIPSVLAAQPYQDYAPPRMLSGTVQGLYQECMSTYSQAQLICLAYITGIVHVMAAIGSTKDSSVLRKVYGMCSKNAISAGAVIQVFKNWTTRHPEKWSYDASTGVIIAFRTTWPCT